MSDSNGAKAAQWMAAETLEEHLEPLLKHYDVKWRGHGRIYVDHEQYNIVPAHRILTDLSARLGVPIQRVHSRLVELGWLIDVRSALPDPNEAVRAAVKERAWAAAHEDAPEMDEEYDQD